MDPNALQNEANNASSQATNMAASLPSVLTELKGSLNQIFNKDNPLIQERTGQLSNYLSAGDNARAEYLPKNSGFAFSPTELNAMVSSRQASALAPLASTNQMIVGQYGGLQDYLGNAKELFGARVTAAQNNATLMRQKYEDAVKAQQQEFDNNLAMAKFEQDKKKSGSGLGSLSGVNLRQSAPPQFIPTSNFGPSRNDYQQPTALPSTSYVQNLAQEKPFWQRWFGGPQPTKERIGSEPLNLNGVRIQL